MKEIDFLPPSYREKNAVRKSRLCQVGLAIGIGVTIALAAGVQANVYRAAKSELEIIAPKYKDAVTKTADLAIHRARLEQDNQYAELYTYLKYPWPRTQLLAEIIENLPPEVTLGEMTIIEEAAQAQIGRSGIAVAVDGKRTPQPHPVADLQLLRVRHDSNQAEIEITGTTTDAATLHLFVMSLNGTRLIESASLNSLQADVGQQHNQSSFLARLKVRPGYGQANGPKPPPAIASQDAAERTGDPS